VEKRVTEEENHLKFALIEVMNVPQNSRILADEF